MLCTHLFDVCVVVCVLRICHLAFVCCFCCASVPWCLICLLCCASAPCCSCLLRIRPLFLLLRIRPPGPGLEAVFNLIYASSLALRGGGGSFMSISHEDCSHEWLWAFDPLKGPVLSCPQLEHQPRKLSCQQIPENHKNPCFHAWITNLLVGPTAGALTTLTLLSADPWKSVKIMKIHVSRPGSLVF